jgi:tRNA(Ile)-lysidine synthase
MTQMRRGKLRAVALAVLACGTSLVAVPVVHAQEGTVDEIRLRKLEAEARPSAPGLPRRRSEILPLRRLDAGGTHAPARFARHHAGHRSADPHGCARGQNTRLTAQVEEMSNRLRKMERGPRRRVLPPWSPRPYTSAAGRGRHAAARRSARFTPPPVAKPKPAPVVARQRRAAKPPASRVAAVKAIVKPQTDDPGEDEYTYGFKLWEAKFYPEAAQQLKLYIDKYPRHKRVSYAKNLLGRAYLDDNQPREAANWFLQNYQGNKRGERAADSLLYLAQAMVDLKDSSRACIALGEFSDTYKTEAAGRLRSQYDDIRKGRRATDGRCRAGRALRFGADADLAGKHERRAPLGLAVSGGPDSLALLLIAHAALPGRVAAATVDHGLRPESAAEAAEVARICALGVPHATLEVSVEEGNVQAQARDARYAALAAWMEREGLSALATAHHADDQAETLVMRLNRASGVSGWPGCASEGWSPRPACRCCAPAGLAPRGTGGVIAASGFEAADDPSNRNPAYDRVRVRQALADAAWVDVPAWSQAAAHLADADAALDWAAAREWAEQV